jgi:hypothetical protein
MSLTAHPYIVLAEQQWKQESLSGANLANPRRRRRVEWHLPRPLGRPARHAPGHTPRRTPRSV